jgi:DNA-binding NarL/FixJ family response regulator
MGAAAPVSVVLVGAGPGPTGDALEAGGVRLLARSGADDATEVVAAAAPQVVVVEVDGAVDDAVRAITALAEDVPDVPVLAVSTGADHGDVLAAVRAGAAGFLTITGWSAELADAVRRTAAGEAVFSPGLAEVVLEQHGRPIDPADARLTGRESDVLRLVVEGLTARQIATRLVLSPRTVENHIQRLLRKFGVPNRAALVRYAIENGLA